MPSEEWPTSNLPWTHKSPKELIKRKEKPEEEMTRNQAMDAVEKSVSDYLTRKRLPATERATIIMYAATKYYHYTGSSYVDAVQVVAEHNRTQTKIDDLPGKVMRSRG